MEIKNFIFNNELEFTKAQKEVIEYISNNQYDYQDAVIDLKIKVLEILEEDEEKESLNKEQKNYLNQFKAFLNEYLNI